MALNFPNNPTDGQTWTDPGSGSLYQYELTGNFWRVIAVANANGTVNYVNAIGSNGIAVTGGPIVDIGEFEFSIDIPGLNDNLTIEDADNFIIEQNRGAQSQNRKISIQTLTSIFGGKPVISDDEPANPTQGQLWWDSVGGKMYIWYEDGSSSQWIEASPSQVDLSSYYTADEVDEKTVAEAGATTDSGFIVWNSPENIRICQQWGVATHNVSGIANITFTKPYASGTSPSISTTTTRVGGSNCYCSIVSLNNTTAQLSATLTNDTPAQTTTRWSAIGRLP